MAFFRAKGIGMKVRSGFLMGAGAAAVVGLLTLGLDTPAEAQAKASACKGLDAAACKAKASACSWVVPKKGKQKPYCRTRTAKKK